jgi:hypothetical protein
VVPRVSGLTVEKQSQFIMSLADRCADDIPSLKDRPRLVWKMMFAMH